jgi:hypothetical protein
VAFWTDIKTLVSQKQIAVVARYRRLDANGIRSDDCALSPSPNQGRSIARLRLWSVQLVAISRPRDR